jgi:hypothetical protein
MTNNFEVERLNGSHFGTNGMLVRYGVSRLQAPHRGGQGGLKQFTLAGQRRVPQGAGGAQHTAGGPNMGRIGEANDVYLARTSGSNWRVSRSGCALTAALTPT